MGDGDSLALKRLAVNIVDTSLCILLSLHFDETEASRLLGVRVVHDVDFLYLSVLAK